MIIKIIGDAHGKFAAYELLIKNERCSIQLGDFGFTEHWQRLYRHKIDFSRHKIIPGNHDGYDYILTDEYAMDWTFNKEYGMINFYDMEFFMLRGAFSVDKKFRTPQWDWWPEEEISQRDLELAFDLYKKEKPEIVITHDCPGAFYNGVSQLMFHKSFIPNRTGLALTRMWDEHKPALWIFGHWHETKIQEIRGTTFVCLGELDSVDYDTEQDVNWNIKQIKKQLEK